MTRLSTRRALLIADLRTEGRALLRWASQSCCAHGGSKARAAARARFVAAARIFRTAPPEPEAKEPTSSRPRPALRARVGVP